MPILKTLLATIALLLLIGPVNAHANIIYFWTGACQTACTGQAAMLVVTTDAYIPGELFSPLGPFPTPTPGFPITTPVLLEARFFSIEASVFRSDATGGWIAGGEEVFPNCDRTHNPLCGYIARGVGGVWTRVPEPSTLVLLGVGLAGLIFYRRRRGLR